MNPDFPLESSVETPLDPLRSINLDPIGDDVSIMATEGVNLIANLRILAEDSDTTAEHLCDTLIGGQKFFKSYSYKQKKIIFEEISIILVRLLENWIIRKNQIVIVEIIRSISFYIQNETDYKVAMGCLGLCPLLCKVMEQYKDHPEIIGLTCRLVVNLINIKPYFNQASLSKQYNEVDIDNDHILRYGVKESEFLQWDNREKLLECGFVSLLTKNLRYWVDICEKYDKEFNEKSSSCDVGEESNLNLNNVPISPKKVIKNSITPQGDLIKKSLESSYQFPEPTWMLDPPLVYVMTNFLECIASLCGNSEISALFYSLGVISSITKLYIDIEPYLESNGIVRYVSQTLSDQLTPLLKNDLSNFASPNSVRSFFSSPYSTQPNSTYSSLASTPMNKTKSNRNNSMFEDEVPIVILSLKDIINFQNSVLWCIILLTTSLGDSVKQNFVHNSASTITSTEPLENHKHSNRHHLASHRLLPHLWKCIDTEGLSPLSKKLRSNVNSALKHFDFQCWLAMLLCSKCSQCKEFSQIMGLPTKLDSKSSDCIKSSEESPTKSSIPSLPPINTSETPEKPKNFIMLDRSILRVKSEEEHPPQPVVLTLLQYLHKESWIPNVTKKRLDKIFSLLFPGNDKKLPSFISNPPIESYSTGFSSPLDTTHSGPFFRFSFSSDPIEVSKF